MAKLRDLSDSLICVPESLELVPSLAFWTHRQEIPSAFLLILYHYGKDGKSCWLRPLRVAANITAKPHTS